MNAWLLYLIFKLTTFRDIFTTIGFTIPGLSLLVCAMSPSDKPFKWVMKNSRKLIFFTIMSLFLAIFIPSTKQIAAIIVLPKLMTNKDIQQLPANLAKLANEVVQNELLQTRNTIKKTLGEK